MTRAEIIEYLYDNNVHGDLKIEDMADDLAEPQWIPSSEPPKNEGTYLVYAPDYRGGSSSSKENYNGVMFSKYKNGKWSIEHGYYERPNCVTAWMPLPTYEGVKE